LKHFPRRIGYSLVAFISLLAVIVSYYIEIVKGLSPCPLCLIQRSIFLSIFLCSLSSLLWPRKRVFHWVILTLSLCLFFTALYHSLIELGYLQSKCDFIFKEKVNNTEDFFSSLIKEKPCNKSPVILNLLPLPLLNLTLSSFFLFVSFKEIDFYRVLSK
jgi:disulfide bond formation protein DsbB